MSMHYHMFLHEYHLSEDCHCSGARICLEGDQSDYHSKGKLLSYSLSPLDLDDYDARLEKLWAGDDAYEHAESTNSPLRSNFGVAEIKCLWLLDTELLK